MGKVFCATLSLRRLLVYKTTRLRVPAALCFAVASQTCASLTLRRLRVYKTTRLQVAAALLVVSLTRCLVVWRSQAKLNSRDSVNP